MTTPMNSTPPTTPDEIGELLDKYFMPIKLPDINRSEIIALIRSEIRQAQADILKQLWNTTQPDLIPEGVPAIDMSEELHRLVAELTKEEN